MNRFAGKVFVHPTALVESERIGDGTRVWAFAHVMKDAAIGRDCNIGDHAFVESGAVVGDRVTIKNGVSVWQHVSIGDDVFVGPNVAFTNDRRPRSRRPWTPEPTTVECGATIGANATLLCGLRVGRHAMVGAGAVVTRDVEPHALVVGSPARRTGWVCACGRRLAFDTGDFSRCECGNAYRLGPDGVAEAGPGDPREDAG